MILLYPQLNPTLEIECYDNLLRCPLRSRANVLPLQLTYTTSSLLIPPRNNPCPGEVLTDAVNTFWMRPQEDLPLIGNFTVVKEEEEVCVRGCGIIHLPR